MLLATIVLAAQVAANPPARTEVARPCADASALCRISPFFCPGTYPQGLEPCWPEARETRTLSSRPQGGAVARDRKAAAPSTRAAERPDRKPAKRGRSHE